MIPRVVAHRGASEEQPEHTLAAYRAALDAGVDGVECDVRLTADQHLVCLHDRRVNRTSNGRGLVSTLELTQLEGLDWGSWKRQAPPDAVEEPDVVTTGDASRLLTLRRLLTEVLDVGRPLEVAIETKHPTRWGSLVERHLVGVLAEFGLLAPDPPIRVRAMSFSPFALRRMRQLAPGLELVMLLPRLPLPMRDGGLPRIADVAGISVEVLRAHPDYPARVHARGGEVHVWTVDEPQDVRRCLAAGVDVIITNRPSQVLSQLRNEGPRFGGLRQG